MIDLGLWLWHSLILDLPLSTLCTASGCWTSGENLHAWWGTSFSWNLWHLWPLSPPLTPSVVFILPLFYIIWQILSGLFESFFVVNPGSAQVGLPGLKVSRACLVLQQLLFGWCHYQPLSGPCSCIEPHAYSSCPEWCLTGASIWFILSSMPAIFMFTGSYSGRWLWSGPLSNPPITEHWCYVCVCVWCVYPSEWGCCCRRISLIPHSHACSMYIHVCHVCSPLLIRFSWFPKHLTWTLSTWVTSELVWLFLILILLILRNGR